MATKMKNTKNVSEASENSVSEEEVQEEMNVELDTSVATKSWLKRPSWVLTFQGNNTAIIKNVTDEDAELLQADDNQGFAKELVLWVNANAGKKKISRFEIAGKLWNCGTRGPGPEDSIKNPFKLRPVKKSRNSSGEKNVKFMAREVTTQDVVQFILSGRLDASVFKAALDEVKKARMEQIQKLQAEIAGLTSWEQLANVDPNALAKVMGGTH